MLPLTILHNVFYNSGLHLQEVNTSSARFLRVKKSYCLGILIDADRQLKRYHISIWKNDYFIVGIDCTKSS